MAIIDNMKALYERERHPYGEGYKPIEQEVLSDTTDREVLDLGCGDGRLAIQLAAQGNRVMGFDAVEGAIRTLNESAAEAELTDLINSRQADLNDNANIEKLIGDDIEFDVVTVVNVMHFLDRQAAEQLLATAANHLSDNGEVVIRGPLPLPPLITGDASRYGAFNKAELVEVLSSAGLKLESFNEFEWKQTEQGGIDGPQPAFIAIAQKSPFFEEF